MVTKNLPFVCLLNVACKCLTPIVASPYPQDQDLNELEFSLPYDSSTQITAFLANWFLKRFLKDFSLYFPSKTQTPIGSTP